MPLRRRDQEHDFAELFKCFIAFSYFLRGATEIIPNFGSLYRVTFCAECSLVASNGAGPVAFAGKRVTEIKLHLSRSGIDRDGFFVMRDGFLQLAVSPKSCTQIVMGIRVTRVERNGLLIITDGFLSLSLLHKSVSEEVIRFRITRIDLERLLQMGDRFFHLTRSDESIPEVALDLHHARLYVESLSVMRDRFVEISLLQQRTRKIIPSNVIVTSNINGVPP